MLSSIYQNQSLFLFFFFFNDTATTEIYTLSLHDALPIFAGLPTWNGSAHARTAVAAEDHEVVRRLRGAGAVDRKSTRLNSSHANISYAVFCLKKKNKKIRKIEGAH